MTRLTVSPLLCFLLPLRIRLRASTMQSHVRRRACGRTLRPVHARTHLIRYRSPVRTVAAQAARPAPQAPCVREDGDCGHARDIGYQAIGG